MRIAAGTRGSTLIETPLILIVFLATIIGILDIGQLMFLQSMLLERARAGVRYAAVSTYSAAAVSNVVVYNNAAGGSGTGLFGLQTSMVSVQRYDAGGSSDRIEVVISNYPLALHGPWLTASFGSRTFRAVIPVQGLGATS